MRGLSHVTNHTWSLSPVRVRAGDPRLAPVVRVARQLWVVFLCMTLAALTANALSQGPARFSAEATLMVPGGEPVPVARTYAAVLGQDDHVSPALASSVQRTRAEVESRLGVVHVASTAAIRVTYEGDSPEEALAAVGTVVRLVTGPEPGTPSVAPGTLITTRMSEQAQEQSGPPALPIGILLGTALGVLLAVALDRSDVRVDDGSDLQGLVTAPVSVLQPSSAALAALAARWAQQADGTDTVALVPARDSDAKVAAGIYTRLREHAIAAGQRGSAMASLPPFDGTGTPLVLEQGSLAGEVRGEMLTTVPTALILVVTKGTPVRKLRAALPALQTLDARLLWCVVASRKTRRWAEPYGAQPAVIKTGESLFHGHDSSGRRPALLAPDPPR
jgi:hypothetical protein